MTISFATPMTQAEIVGCLDEAEQKRSSRARGLRVTVLVAQLALLIGFLGSWEFASSKQIIDPTFFSSPRDVLGFLREYVVSGEIWEHLLITVRETMLAFVLGSLLGVFAGLVLVSFPISERVLSPFLTILNALPRVALAPMFIIWFGIGESSKVALAVSLVFFIMMIATQTGAKSIDQEYRISMRAMGARRWYVFRNLILPSSIPAIFGGLRLGVVYALVGVVFGEMLAAQAGLGQQLQYFAGTFQTAGVMGCLLVLALLALAINGAVVLLEKRLLRWNPDN